MKDTFALVVEQPTERRGAMLRELCGDDFELQGEVESLLAAHDDPHEPIVADAFGIRAGLHARVVHPQPDRAHLAPDARVDVGRVFGPYRIIREIGRGGMGAVFLAERADGEFHRYAALKILRHSVARQELERRFRRERQILATLSHPHIAHLLDGGVSADGEPFFVMEYVEGVRIDEYCARAQLTTRERLKLFLQVCRAVAYAHERMIVHRDLKPSNILVTHEGVPKLLDFGIAKLLETGGAGPGEDTATEFRAFTPDYASPEQVRGEQTLTAATDVYSLGVLLDALLARRRASTAAAHSLAPEPGHAAARDDVGPALPGGRDDERAPGRDRFEGRDDREIRDGRNDRESRDTRQRSAGVPPARATPADARRDTSRTDGTLHRELQHIIAMARRPEPDRRYASARELGQDIERHLDGLPVLAQPDTVRYRAAKFIERHKAALTAMVLVVGALVIGVIGATSLATWRGGRAGTGTDATTSPAGASSASPSSAAPSAAASAGPPGAGAAARRHGGLLVNVKTIAVLPLRSLPTAVPAAASARASTQTPDDQALRVGVADSIVMKLSQIRRLTVRPTSATVRYLDQDYDAVAVGRELQVDGVLEGTLQRAGNELRTNLQLVDVRSGAVVWADSLISDLTNVLRGQESLANRVTQVLALNVAGAAALAAGSPHISPDLGAQAAYLRGSLALATSMRHVANIVAARDGFEQAIRLDPGFALAHAGLANAYTLAGSLTILAPQDAYPKAERAARRALEIEPDLAVAYVALAEIEADYNWNWRAAEANNRRAIELAPNSSGAHHSYAEFLARQGRFTEAATHSDIAQQLDPTRSNYGAVRALHYYYEHRFADAIAQSEQTIKQDPTTYLAYLYLAVSHAAQGTYAAGLDAARRAGTLTGGAVPDLFVMGVNYALMNDRARLDPILERLHAMSRERYVDPFHFVALYAYLGDKPRAFEYLQRSYTERSYWMTTLKVHPVVNSLRGDARFAEAMRRMNLD